jgi:hypothetical protein
MVTCRTGGILSVRRVSIPLTLRARIYTQRQGYEASPRYSTNFDGTRGFHRPLHQSETSVTIQVAVEIGRRRNMSAIHSTSPKQLVNQNSLCRSIWIPRLNNQGRNGALQAGVKRGLLPCISLIHSGLGLMRAACIGYVVIGEWRRQIISERPMICCWSVSPACLNGSFG